MDVVKFGSVFVARAPVVCLCEHISSKRECSEIRRTSSKDLYFSSRSAPGEPHSRPTTDSVQHRKVERTLRYDGCQEGGLPVTDAMGLDLHQLHLDKELDALQ